MKFLRLVASNLVLLRSKIGLPTSKLLLAGTLFLIGLAFTGIAFSQFKTKLPSAAKPVDPDLPASMKGLVNDEEYIVARNAYIQMRLGMTPGQTYDPMISRPRR